MQPRSCLFGPRGAAVSACGNGRFGRASAGAFARDPARGRGPVLRALLGLLDRGPSSMRQPDARLGDFHPFALSRRRASWYARAPSLIPASRRRPRRFPPATVRRPEYPAVTPTPAPTELVADAPGRERDNQALRDERFRLLVQAVTDYALVMLDPDGRVVCWNAGAERVFGYPDAAVVGGDYARFFTPEDAAAGEPARELRAARGRPVRGRAVAGPGGRGPVPGERSDRRHPRGRRPAARVLADHPRCDRPAATGGAGPAGPEDGGDGAAGRRDRARLQQPAHRHHRVQRRGPRRAPRGAPVPRPGARGAGGRGAGRGADRASCSRSAARRSSRRRCST